MKKTFNTLKDVPNATPIFNELKSRLKAGKLTPKNFAIELRHNFGDELFDSAYTSWRGLKQRAKQLHSPDGVSLSPEFQKFHSFVISVGLRPSRPYTLDRKNGALGYTVTNCHWTDKKTQTRNRAITVFATDKKGQTETLAKWAEITGTPLKTLSKRRSNGWSDPDIIHGRLPLASSSIRRQYRPYGTSARMDYSPSGDHWPPKTLSGWEVALSAYSGWDREDKAKAFDHVTAHRNGYTRERDEYVEDIYIPVGYGPTPWEPSEQERDQLDSYAERIKYFNDWLRQAHRAMFPKTHIPPRDIW